MLLVLLALACVRDIDRGDFASAELYAIGDAVMIMGYYGIPEGAEFGFDACVEELNMLSSRQAKLADSHPLVFFADAAVVMDGSDTSMYDRDRIHPSTDGSEVVGMYIAEQIRAIEQTRRLPSLRRASPDALSTAASQEIAAVLGCSRLARCSQPLSPRTRRDLSTSATRDCSDDGERGVC